MRTAKSRRWLAPAAMIMIVALYFLPPIHSRMAWRVDALRRRIIYAISPPQATIFRPTQQVDVTAIYATTRAEYSLTLTPGSTATPYSGVTTTPTRTPLPLPASVVLPGVVYVDQHNRWNYCGPANLTMALKFWGWSGDRDDVAAVVKPGSSNARQNFIERGKPDKNVMPYEMVDFVNEQTELRALWRHGGSLTLIRELVAQGFPVVIEKGYIARDPTGALSWMGHYQFVTGYDQSKGTLQVQDAYEFGPDYEMTYAEIESGWRAFNFLFLLVYPPEREAELLALLGSWADEAWAEQRALETAEAELESLSGIDVFFAWFNKGTSHVMLHQYVDAAVAYDAAYGVLARLDCAALKCPWRMTWYQTGPYFAYYYSSRYQDVINLANITLDDPADSAERTLEESLLWRGRARVALGDTQAAIEDFRAAIDIHVDWLPAVQALAELGAQP